ncbi:hypothetical protein VF04_36730 [Nostoc linckia z7]|uniref:Uncharacterized protein n=1 Tax=Nostoc linckia z7 TaxID=1628745 RepID=A0ABX4KI43_NOSLI|nr:hypothetical protein [Nostoc linckia]PHJ51669.1 hypothetical protein VF02_37795 [Nostoc linckia z1]PHJ59303.1 hypothetical protein VF05_32445 [Nostoc linckia z3]PHJ63628.1 hypothetical protein VF03_29955 [Nostoc linckia z2]PHJ70432.1 hypothetical protein VF06_37650 [Nostoc linckia z4]PHJ83478.1 hypothetical protein VF04_36730 [Nostoc linckia z7]
MLKPETAKKVFKPVENPEIEESYHLAWANKACVWILKKLDYSTNTAYLQTGRGKKITSKISDLRHLASRGRL